MLNVEKLQESTNKSEKTNYVAPKSKLRLRRKIIRTLIFTTIIGYSCGGNNIYYDLKYQPYANLRREKERILQAPAPKMISNAQVTAIGNLFGYKQRGEVRFDAFNKALDDCKQNSKCSVLTFPAKEILDPEEYTLTMNGYCAEFDGHDYNFGDLSTVDGSAFVLAFRIIETEGFLNGGEKFIFKPFLVGGAKAEEDKTIQELKLEARKNAKKNLHDSYMYEYGPQVIDYRQRLRR